MKEKIKQFVLSKGFLLLGFGLAVFIATLIAPALAAGILFVGFVVRIFTNE